APQSSGFRGSPLLVRPMTPSRSRLPSGWMLLGLIVPWAQPLSSACCAHEGGPPPSGRNPPPNPYWRTIGTLPAARFGTVKLAWMATLIRGKAPLSTVPTSVLVTVAIPPLSPSSALVTSHLTFGTFLGMRP